jgi:hypothetical protein
VAIRLNSTYRDARYAVNHVALIEVSSICRDYSESIRSFLVSSVAGEQCWIDNYVGGSAAFYPNVLNIGFSLSHPDVVNWYFNSLAGADMNQFNNGLVAGAYWSVLGPGKNLQLAPTPDKRTYMFKWVGSVSSGYMDFYNESQYPGKLPEPVTLAEPVYLEEERGYRLTCEESENAVGYELLVGSDPYRVMDYEVLSNTPAPPNGVTTPLFFEEGWWTVRARDEYGSTIYADPKPIKPVLQILDVFSDGEMNFKDFALLARYWLQKETPIDLAPPPFGDGEVDIRDVAVIANYWLADFRAMAHWKLDEREGDVANDSIGGNNGTLHGDPNWQPTGGKVAGALEFDGVDDYINTAFVLNPADGAFSICAWVKEGGPGQSIISQTGTTGTSWLLADLAGCLTTYLKRPGRGGQPLISEFVITDGDWHLIHLVWDGAYRSLYADGAEVKKDLTNQTSLIGADGGLRFGTGSYLAVGSFWAGLIDDIKIYERAITP